MGGIDPMFDYYNYNHRAGNEFQLRRSFLSHLWRAYKKDPHWSPPEYKAMRAALIRPHPHLARQRPLFVHSHAIRRRVQRSSQENWSGGDSIWIDPIIEETVGLGEVLHDPRRKDQTAYLAQFITANDPDCLEQLLSALLEKSASRGYQRIIGPTGFSIHLGGGLLVDHWRETPPLYTAYDPPYLAEIVRSVMTPIQTGKLYHLVVPKRPQKATGPARLEASDPATLKSTLLPLFQSAVESQALAVELDRVEADFLLTWISSWPIHLWLALERDQPIGFVLLQPDVAPLLKRANGGRRPWWRAWLRWAARRSVRSGRIVFGGVLSTARGYGFGRQLLSHSMQVARQMGWESISIGPILDDTPAAQFLVHSGAHPRQTYQYFEWP